MYFFMTILTSDFECNTFQKGNPYSRQGKAICLGWKIDDTPAEVEYDINNIFAPSTLLQFDLCVFFNAKFDLTWYRRLEFQMPKNVWCCQLAEFFLERQSNSYPSLEQAAEKYGLSKKLDVVKLEYWDKNVDTENIPREILSPYCIQDVELTYTVYLRQQKAFASRPGLYKLFKLACQDLLILQEMEWNGLLYDETLCLKRIKECEDSLLTHSTLLRAVYPNVPINFGSNDQLSAFLYGGKVDELVRELAGTFKSGKQRGQPKYVKKIIEHILPRLVTPLPKSEMSKENVFSTSADTLKVLKGPAAKKYVGPLLEMARLEKLISTYYRGIPELTKKMAWQNNMVHGQFNQCVAATGRLSSSKPNLQNFAGEVEDIFISRYAS
jgi:DNA polymerase I-like protein with 3'-5' exonuclease and polymerase domains